MNPAYATVFRRDPADLYRDPAALHQAVHPDDRERIVGLLEAGTPSTYQVEYRILLPGGERRWLLERGVPLLGPGNQAECQIGIIADITASREAHEDLHRLNRRLEQRIAERTEHMRMMIESSAEAVITINSDGVIEEWNRAAERIFGWNRAEVSGRRLSELIIPHRYRAAHDAGMRRFLANGPHGY